MCKQVWLTCLRIIHNSEPPFLLFPQNVMFPLVWLTTVVVLPNNLLVLFGSSWTYFIHVCICFHTTTLRQERRARVHVFTIYMSTSTCIYYLHVNEYMYLLFTCQRVHVFTIYMSTSTRIYYLHVNEYVYLLSIYTTLFVNRQIILFWNKSIAQSFA